MDESNTSEIMASIKTHSGGKYRKKWRLPCFYDFGKNKSKLIISDSQLQVRSVKMAKKVPGDSCLISFPGASSSDLLWLFCVGRVGPKGEENLIFTHNPDKNPLPREEEMSLKNNKFLDHASFLTKNFTQYRCFRCRDNCLKNKELIINIGINDYLYRTKNETYTNALKPIANLKTLSKLFTNMNLKNFHFIHVPKIRCKTIQSKPKLYKKIINDISEFNKQIIKIHQKNNSTNFTFSEIHLGFRHDLIHFDENCVYQIYEKIASL